MLLAVEDLHAHYDKSHVLHGVRMHVEAGEIVCLLGRNGVGKSTTIKSIIGFTPPRRGQITLRGVDVTRLPSHRTAQMGVGLVPQGRSIFPALTVRENIILALQASRGWFNFLSQQKQYEIANNYIKLLNINTSGPDQLVKNLSGGNQQKVILARWLATNPRILILDEPTRGIDVGAKAEFQKLVLELAEEGRACIFISSELEEVLGMSDRILVMRGGRIVGELARAEATQERILALAFGEVQVGT